jgi:hypothetical protein
MASLFRAISEDVRDWGGSQANGRGYAAGLEQKKTEKGRTHGSMCGGLMRGIGDLREEARII